MKARAKCLVYGFSELNEILSIATGGCHVVPTTLTVQVDVMGTQIFSDIDQPFSVVVTYGACPGTLPCDEPGPCYPGPGDIVPTPNPPFNPCDLQATVDEFEGGEPDPKCDSPGAVPADPADPVDPTPVD